MPTISIPISYNIGQVEAVKRVKNLTSNSAYLPSSLSDLKVIWLGNKSEFTVIYNKIPIKGNLTIGPNGLSITGRIPFILLPFKSKISKIVKDYAENILK